MIEKKVKDIFKFSQIVFFFLICFLAGCASVARKDGLQLISLEGMPYVSLAEICNRKNIVYEYDMFSRVATLEKGAHRISAMLGQNMVVVDGKPEHIKGRVQYYQDTVVVPLQFKEAIIDSIFREEVSAIRKSRVNLRLKKVVIDAGHGGYDPGTIGKSGLREKDINLDIANRLAKLLRDDGVKVILTRSSDRFIVLEQRPQIANKEKADLFVSIHTNANRIRSMSGFEVYYVSPAVSDLKRARESAQQGVLKLERASYDYMTSNLKAILWDMIYTYNRGESITLAGTICESVKQDLNTKILGVKGAKFAVLKGAQMPAVLVEIGFLSNKNEEQLLKNNFYRQQIAEAIADGIERYGSNCELAEGVK